MQMRLINGLVKQRISFSRPRGTAKQAVFRSGIVKFSLPVKWLVPDFLAEFFKAANTFLRKRLVGLGTHEMMCDGLSSARFSLRGLVVARREIPVTRTRKLKRALLVLTPPSISFLCNLPPPLRLRTP